MSHADSAPADGEDIKLVVGKFNGTSLFSYSLLDCLQQMPSPGIVIFVMASIPTASGTARPKQACARA